MTQIGSGFSGTHPFTFAQDRRGIVYGVNGQARGFRWDGVTAQVQALGLKAPGSAPSVTASSTDPKYYVSRIDILDRGLGYETEPTVEIDGTGGAKAKALLLHGSVHRVTMQDYGKGYTEPPAVTVEQPTGDPIGGSGAEFTVSVSGEVMAIWPTGSEGEFEFPPTVTISAPEDPEGMTATAIAIITQGVVTGFLMTNRGSGYTAVPTVLISGGYTTPDPLPDLWVEPSATAVAIMDFRVVEVDVDAAGSGYSGTPRLTFRSVDGGGAVAHGVITDVGSGAIDSVDIVHGGAYRQPEVTAEIATSPHHLPRMAKLAPVMVPEIRPGKYWCAVRYVDATAQAAGGPIPSSISELTEVDVTEPAGSLSWTWSNSGMDARVSRIELWRSTADQALVLYRVASLGSTATSYTDTVGDNELINRNRKIDGEPMFAALPIVLPNGAVNARRFHPPPQNKAAMVMFQDRAWYGVDVPGRTYDGASDASAAAPNALYFSEIDEPESVPPVNELVIQDNVNGTDSVTALMPFGGGMVVFQSRHAYRLSYVAQPVIDASITMISQRGCINQRCWDLSDNTAYVADSLGIYALNGETVTPLTGAISNFWSEDLIHFASSKWFFLRVDPVSSVVRFFHSAAAGYPDRALCYHPGSKAWWLEVYAQTFAASAAVRSSGRLRDVVGGQGGALLLHDTGGSDLTSDGNSQTITCEFRTGPLPLVPADKERTVRLLYSPTTATCTASMQLHYNNSPTPRPAAVASNPGSGWATTAGGPATLNLATARSPLGDATGYATAWYSGRVDERSAGADRHLAVSLSIPRPSDAPVRLHGIAVAGVAK